MIGRLHTRRDYDTAIERGGRIPSGLVAVGDGDRGERREREPSAASAVRVGGLGLLPRGQGVL
jgi:hypothetical protein